jgi:mono/diheme cytochrome c family protein
MNRARCCDLFRRPSVSALLLALLLVAMGKVHAAENDRHAVAARSLLARYCADCHGAATQEGKLRLDDGAPTFDQAGATRWQRVIERIELNQMPPESAPQPSAEERRALQAWIEAETQAVEHARRAKEGRVALRRLNRIEYQNTIRDLLGIEVNLQEQLPADGAADGFDNAAAALHTSSFLMERYLETADVALNLAIANRPQPPKRTQNSYHFKEARPVANTTESVYRILDDTVVCFCSSAWHNVFLPKFYPAEGGYYRFRIAASGYQSNGKPVTFRVTAGNTRLSGTSGLVGYFDAPPNETKVFEFVRYMEPKTSISMLPYGLQSAQAVKAVGAEKYEGPGLALEWAEVEGPLVDAWPPESHRRLFGDQPQQPAPAYNARDRVEIASDQPLVDAERILRKFTARAFRRPVTDADVAPFVQTVSAKLAADYTFEQAVRAALKGVLIAPEFLFLRETPGRLSDEALASRLSYFLWSTMPDDELLDLAAHKKLSDPTELKRQVERMLADRRAAAFTENFVGQWLGLREIDFTEPSHILYPEFDHLLKVSMIRETELFFDEVLKHDLSLTNFTASDFTLLNGRLAKHYGIEGPAGWEFQKVMLPEGSRRGGVLTMASVLKVTANGTTTSPVIRGAWVLDRLLGTPPSPPPADVPAIDPDIRGATTIREQLAKHRASTACAGCHVKIDPPGFALESFDCIGGYRDRYRVTGSGDSVVVDGRRMAYHIGKKVDPSDVMEDGAPFADVDEFKQLLLRDKDRLARALTMKLLTYATGAAPTSIDRPEIDAIVTRIRPKGYGLRSLVHEIVQSELFQMK